MNDAKKSAIAFFKRYPKAVVAHVVIDKVTDDIRKAAVHKKAVYAKKISTFLRQQCAIELGEADNKIDQKIN